MLWLLLVALVCCRTASTSSYLCPVSQSAPYRESGHFQYPKEIYFGNVKDQHSKPRPCQTYSEEDGKRWTNYTCSHNVLGCPVVEENLEQGSLSTKSWKKSTSLCGFGEALSNPDTKAKVIVFGGSVTVGVNSKGCCDTVDCRPLGVDVDICKACSWPFQVKSWLNRSNIELYNLADRGMASMGSAEKIDAYLASAGIKELSGRDVVFIDHSFNDISYCRNAPAEELKMGLEKLVRRIYSYAKDALPTIVLVETDTRYHIPDQPCCFQGPYRDIARHYGLRIYSYRDAILDKTSLSLQSAFHDALTEARFGRYAYQFIYHPVHPPWDIHLFYADFLVGSLLLDMKACSVETTTQKGSEKAPLPVLPAPLTAVNDRLHCDVEQAPVLLVTYDRLMAGTATGNMSIGVPSGWSVGLDRAKRGGILSQLTDLKDFSSVNHGSVTFALNMTINELRRHNNTWLHLTYMRSYEHSGRARLTFCGQSGGGEGILLDALWEDHEKFRFSVPHMHKQRIPGELCTDVPGYSPVTATVTHVLDPRVTSVTALPRGAQTFKIIEALACRY